MQIELSKKAITRIQQIQKMGNISNVNAILNRAIEEYYQEYKDNLKAIKKYEQGKQKRFSASSVHNN